MQCETENCGSFENTDFETCIHDLAFESAFIPCDQTLRKFVLNEFSLGLTVRGIVIHEINNFKKFM